MTSCIDTTSLIDEIIDNNLVESKYIGFGGQPSDEYKRFAKLKRWASKRELDSMCQHSHPIIRTYGFQIKLDRGLIDSEKAFKLAMESNGEYRTMNADIMSGSDICTNIYFTTLNKYPSIEEENYTYKTIQNSELNKLDSIIIFEFSKDHFLHYMALNDKTHSSTFNNRIVELAIKQKVPSAVFYIDEKKIETDTSQLIESIEYIIENKFIGSEPKSRMTTILNRLKRKN